MSLVATLPLLSISATKIVDLTTPVDDDGRAGEVGLDGSWSDDGSDPGSEGEGEGATAGAWSGESDTFSTAFSSSSNCSSPASSLLSPSTSSLLSPVTSPYLTPASSVAPSPRSSLSFRKAKTFDDDAWLGSFSLKLAFSSTDSAAGEDPSLPPAFFPSARISFAPKLRISSSSPGIPYHGLSRLVLGVTGMCEVLDPSGEVISQRLVVDFVTDVSSGLKIWKRDADLERARRSQIEEDEIVGNLLPPGSYSLPLSMRIPSHDRL